MNKPLSPLSSSRAGAPPLWWWLGLAAMALLFALLRVMLEMQAGATTTGVVDGAGAVVDGEVVGADEGGLSGVGALEALLRSCVPPTGAGAEEWWLWAFFMVDLGVMGLATMLAVWCYARPRLAGLAAAARIPLEDEARV